MKIVADKDIPFLKGVFEPYAQVKYLDGRSITKSDIEDADALITRTRTKCDALLLRGSRLKLIASATIGLDHVDTRWCAANGIAFRNAPGCNANGVVEYVFSAVYGVAGRKSVDLEGATLGVVGVGNVGSRVAKLGRILGFNVLENDPPRAEKEGSAEFCPLDRLLRESDVVTMHVPLDESTRTMADASFFDKMKKGAFFVNASRGEVVVDAALIDARPKLGGIVVDTWNGEPQINRKLLEVTDVATPHIAGYSYQGKQNGTAAAVRTVARFFGIGQLYDFYPQSENPSHQVVKLDLRGRNQDDVRSRLLETYPIFEDDSRFRQNPADFEEFRKNYAYRNEFCIV